MERRSSSSGSLGSITDSHSSKNSFSSSSVYYERVNPSLEDVTRPEPVKSNSTRESEANLSPWVGWTHLSVLPVNSPKKTGKTLSMYDDAEMDKIYTYNEKESNYVIATRKRRLRIAESFVIIIGFICPPVWFIYAFGYLNSAFDKFGLKCAPLYQSAFKKVALGLGITLLIVSMVCFIVGLTVSTIKH